MVQDLYTRPKLLEFDDDFNWEIMRGDSQTMEFYLTAEDPDGNLSAYDLTGALVKLTVRKTTDDADPLIEKSSADSSEIQITDITGLDACGHSHDEDPPRSVFEVYFVPDDTNDLEPARYVYDVEITTSGGAIHTPVKGFVKLLADVTRPQT